MPRLSAITGGALPWQMVDNNSKIGASERCFYMELEGGTFLVFSFRVSPQSLFSQRASAFAMASQLCCGLMLAC